MQGQGTPPEQQLLSPKAALVDDSADYYFGSFKHGVTSGFASPGMPASFKLGHSVDVNGSHADTFDGSQEDDKLDEADMDGGIAAVLPMARTASSVARHLSLDKASMLAARSSTSARTLASAGGSVTVDVLDAASSVQQGEHGPDVAAESARVEHMWAAWQQDPTSPPPAAIMLHRLRKVCAVHGSILAIARFAVMVMQ